MEKNYLVSQSEEDGSKEEISRLNEEVARLDAMLTSLRENYMSVNEKMKEVGNMKENIRVSTLYIAYHI